jgi:membrane protein
LKTWKEISDSYLASKPVVVLRNWAMATVLPGFQGVSLHEVYDFLKKELRENNLNSKANSIAFSFFISLFPTIIVMFTLMAYFPIYKNFYEFIKGFVHDLMPGNAEIMVMDAIKDLTTIKRKGLLSIGFILAIYFSSNGMAAMMSGFEKTHKKSFKRFNFFYKRLIALQLTFLLGFLLFASVILVILGNTLIAVLIKFVKASWFSFTSLFLLRILAIVVLMYGGISIIYRFGAPLRRKMPFWNPGAILATFGSIMTSVIFSYYVDNFGNYNKVYGSIGTLIALMVWLQINIFIVLAGFELNASISVSRDMKIEDGGQ